MIAGGTHAQGPVRRACTLIEDPEQATQPRVVCVECPDREIYAPHMEWEPVNAHAQRLSPRAQEDGRNSLYQGISYRRVKMVVTPRTRSDDAQLWQITIQSESVCSN